MFRKLLFIVLLVSLTAGSSQTVFAQSSLRAPATPLIAIDPYFSVWSNTDELADSFPVHWTGTINALTSFVKIDGKNYRLMGRCADMDGCQGR